MQADMENYKEYSNENVIGGVDLREKVNVDEMDKFPQNCVCLLRCYDEKFPTTPIYGTGFLISPDLVLTSAHNIYNPQKQRTFGNFEVYPGYTGLLNSYFKVKDYRYPKEFRDIGIDELKYNYALMKLSKRVQREEYIHLGVNYQENLENVATYGYPEKWVQPQGLGKRSAKQYRCLIQEQMKIKDGEGVLNSLSTTGGQSGSPIFLGRKKKSLAIAIHEGFSNKHQLNTGKLITPEVILNIWKWEKEMIESEIHVKWLERRESNEKEGKLTGVESPEKLQQLLEMLEAEKKIEKKMEEEKIKKKIEQKPEGNWDTSTPYAKKFRVEGRRVTKITQNGDYYQLVSAQSLPQATTTRATFRLQKYGASTSSIGFGILPASIKKKRYSHGYQHSAVASYQSFNLNKIGAIFSDNEKIMGWDAGLFVPEGGELEMEVDLLNWRIKWTNGRKWSQHNSPPPSKKKLSTTST